MKKLLALIMAFAMAMSMVACSSAPASSTSTEESTETTQTTVKAPETELFMFVDGADVTDGNTTYDSVSAKFAETEIEGIKYTGTTLTNLCA